MAVKQATRDAEVASTETETAPTQQHDHDRTQFSTGGMLPAVELGTATVGPSASERAFDGAAQNAAGISVTVAIPPGATHDQIRDEVLRSPAFGFEDADLQSLAHALAKNPSFFFLCDSRTPDKHATSQQIASWADAKTHLATIPIPADRVAALRGLKSARANADIDAALNMVDGTLRGSLKPLLASLLGPAGDSRSSAADSLAGMIESNGDQIAHVLDTLSARYQHDPMVAALRGLANAKASRAPANFVGPLERPGILDTARADRAESEAGDASRNLQQQVEAGSVDRREASKIFDLNARSFAATGNVERSEQAAMTSRFYIVDDKERASVVQHHDHDVPVLAPGTTAMQAPSEADVKLGEVREERESVLREWEELDSGREVPETPPMLESKDERTNLANGRQIAERSSGVSTGMGALSLASTFLKFRAAAVRTEMMVKLRNREDKLVREVYAENHYPVPAHPEELERLAHRLDQIASTGGQRGAKAREYADKVREQLELSRAFWASR